MRSTDGSSASPTMSPLRCGSATTMATASAARSAPVRPGHAWRCRSSSRSCRPIWAEGIAPKAPLNGPSPEAKRHLVDLPIDYMSGSRIGGGQRGGQAGNQYGDQGAAQFGAQTGGHAFIEHFRVEADGKINETQYQLVSHGDAEAASNPEPETEQSWGDWGWRNPGSQVEQGWGAWGWGCRESQPYPSQNRQPWQSPPPQPRARGWFAPPWSDN